MEEWQKKHIRKHLPGLLGLIQLTSLSSDLMLPLKNLELLTDNECDKLQAKRYLEGRAEETVLLYEIVQRKEGAYDKLIAALDEAQLTGASRILKDGREEWERSNEASTSKMVADNDDDPSPPPSKKFRVDLENNGIKSDHGKYSEEGRLGDKLPPPILPPKANVALAHKHVDDKGIPECSEVNSPSTQATIIPDSDDKLDLEVLDFINSTEKLDVVVLLPARDMTLDGFADSYKLPTGQKGLALILNIVEFANAEVWKRRNGSEKDMENLTELLFQLGYEIFPKSKKERDKEIKIKLDIKEHIQEFKERCQKRQPASIIVFIGSHGFHPNQIVTSDPPYTNEKGKKVQVTLDLYRDIVSEFFHENCPELKGRPKVFLVQACQTFFRNETDDHCQGQQREPKIADTIVCTAQMPGGSANRDKFKGSWFVHCFTYMMMKHARDKSLQEILNMVTEMLERIQGVKGTEQVPVITSHKLKELYFPIDP